MQKYKQSVYNESGPSLNCCFCCKNLNAKEQDGNSWPAIDSGYKKKSCTLCAAAPATRVRWQMASYTRTTNGSNKTTRSSKCGKKKRSNALKYHCIVLIQTMQELITKLFYYMYCSLPTKAFLLHILFQKQNTVVSI